ncbi:MAG TPA: PRC-barrel domain-containing protein [Chthoniobacterales bacterium]|nr:PRC-barrel domain-containing protein [Chthoniobacterales bacterium]
MEKFQSPTTTIVTTKAIRKSVSLLYMKALDSYTENEACPLIGRRVVDVGGKKTSSLRRIWLDPSTYHVEFAGVRGGWWFPRTCVVPARDIRIDEESDLIRLEHPRAFISKAPHANPKAELAEIEKEEIDAYYGYFVPLRRTSDIKEIRPEDALNGPGLPRLTATVDELLLHGEANSAESRI